MSSKPSRSDLDSFLEVILNLESKQEAMLFFKDLLTESELFELCNRWRVAKLLWKKISYSQIEKLTGVSSTTIARISKWLNTGHGGYRKMLGKI